MRDQKTILTLLTQLTKLVAEEAERNADFASRLEAILDALPADKRSQATKPASPRKAKPAGPLPDLIVEYQARGAEEFHLWLRDLPVPTLKALVKANDMDAAKRASRWRDAAKLARLILDQTQARLNRGGAFLSR